MKHLRPCLLLGAVGFTLATLLSACQPEGDGTASNVPKLVIRATDGDYDVPAETSAGMTEVTLDNQGTGLHQLSLVQLKDGKAFDDFTAHLQTAKESDPAPSWAVAAGGPVVAAPGQQASSFVSLEQGTYAMRCYIPDAEGVPNFVGGMINWSLDNLAT